MGISAGIKAGLKSIARSIGDAATSFTRVVSKASDEAVTSFKKAADDLVKGVAEAGDDVGSLKNAFTDYSRKLDELGDAATGADKEFFKNFKDIVNPQITKALDDISEAASDAAKSTQKGTWDKIGDAINSPTSQKLILGLGVFGGMMYIKQMQEDIEEDRGACIAACLPTNWDEYQSDTSVELKYTTQDELETLDLKGGPICTAAKLTNPGCYTHCNNECTKLNPSFLSKYIDPFTEAVTDVVEDVAESTGTLAGAAASAAAKGAGAAAGGFFGGFGLPLSIAAIVIVMIIVAMTI